MAKKFSIIGLLLLAIAFNAAAHDNDRITQLEKETQEIKHRLSEIESSNKKPSMAQEVIASSDGWKSIANWRKLTTGMSTSDVRRILGEPDRIDGGGLAYWYYRNDGEVTFFENEVSRWKEPRD